MIGSIRVFAWLAGAVILPGVARAHSCEALLSDLATFAADDASSPHFLEFKMVGKQQTGDAATYAIGAMDYTDGAAGDGYLARLATTPIQTFLFFSDRLPGYSFPFSDPWEWERPEMHLVVDPGAPEEQYGELTVSYPSLGTETVETQCHGGFLYATLLYGQQMLVFTFARRPSPYLEW